MKTIMVIAFQVMGTVSPTMVRRKATMVITAMEKIVMDMRLLRMAVV